MILRRGTCELHSGKLPLILLSEPLEPTQCNVDPLDSKEEARLSRSYDVDSPLAQSAAGIAQTSVLSLTPAAQGCTLSEYWARLTSVRTLERQEAP